MKHTNLPAHRVANGGPVATGDGASGRAAPADPVPGLEFTRRRKDGWAELKVCPICSHKGWCRAFTDGAIGCRFDSTGTPTRSGAEWIHWPNGRPDDWQARLAAIPLPPPRPVHDPNLLDRAYRALLARCPLAEHHRADLRRKGFTEAEIDNLGHGSLPTSDRERARIAGEVAAELGINPVGVVPFFVPGALGPTVCAGDEGQRLIPVHDRQGRIVGLRRRIDGATDNKYRWGSGGDGGASIDGNTVHWALPIHGRRTGVVGITEGEDKANLAALRLGHPMISLPGVGNQAHVIAALREAGPLTHVPIYFDKDPDPDTAARVAAHERRLAATIAAEFPHVVVLQGQWHPDNGKGLDDVLAVGLTPITTNHPLLTDDAHPVAPSAQLAELDHSIRELKTENSLLNRIVGNKRLGGDVGNTAAVRIANYATWYADAKGVRPGESIPLVATQIAKEYYDPARGENVEAISNTTVSKAIERFVGKGVLETVEAEHVYTTPAGVEKRIKVPGLVWNGRPELLERFAAGTVYGEDEERNRGGRRERRSPLVCPTCGQTHAACVTCSQAFDAVTLRDGYAHLVNRDDPYPEDGDDAFDDEPCPGENAGTDGFETAEPGSVLQIGDYVRNRGEREEDVPFDEATDQRSLLENADEDDPDELFGVHRFPVENAGADRERERHSAEDRRYREANRLLGTLRACGVVPYTRSGRLWYVGRIDEHLRSRISEVERELVDLLGDREPPDGAQAF